MKMSKYSITIKNLMDNNFDFQMTLYPIFDENYRNTLNNNILIIIIKMKLNLKQHHYLDII